MDIIDITILILIMCILASILTTGITIRCLKMINELERELVIVRRQKAHLSRIVKEKSHAQ